MKNGKNLILTDEEIVQTVVEEYGNFYEPVGTEEKEEDVESQEKK